MVSQENFEIALVHRGWQWFANPLVHGVEHLPMQCIVACSEDSWTSYQFGLKLHQYRMILQHGVYVWAICEDFAQSIQDTMMGRIILADDDDLIAALVTDILIDAGHAVGRLGDGAAALDVINQRPPDLVILDCNMPKMSGIQVLKEMRRTDHLHHIPVLMLTGRASVHDENIARFTGASDYLRKPFDPVQLVDRAEELLAGRRRLV